MDGKKSFAEMSSQERILARLAGGGWVSGEDLAGSLGVSRMAVAKQIDKLRREGHLIRSRTHKGYMLEVPMERLSREAVVPLLRTAVLGRTEWRELESTPSTNSCAIAWALEGGPAGAVVTAHEQTNGKGRRGHSWFSSPRGMHLSVILPPRGGAGQDARVTMAALQALQRAVAATAGVEAAIKKPNDLFLNGKKICGILVESGQRGGETDWLVLGIGCNVNVVPDEFPEEIRSKTTSLYAECGAAIAKNRLAAETLNHLEELLLQDN